eukprot:1535343-Rhodomonas_salina.2
MIEVPSSPSRPLRRSSLLAYLDSWDNPVVLGACGAGVVTGALVPGGVAPGVMMAAQGWVGVESIGAGSPA